MARDLQIANKLRMAGLHVVEIAGWQTRGSDAFNPQGFVWHHTAGPRNGNSPSLTICTYGRAGLPGPLCNIFLARDNTIYVVAAGRANHAGTGGWKGLTGNSSVYGIEIENTGTGSEPWRADQLLVAAAIAAALVADSSKCCMHKEWTSRKIDMHTASGNDMRALHAKIRNAPISTGPAPTPASPNKDGNMASYMRNPENGDIFEVTETHYRHLGGQGWKTRDNFHRFTNQGRPLVPADTHPLAILKWVADFELQPLPPTK